MLVDNFNYDRYFQEISKDPYVVEGNWEYPKMNKEEKLPDYRFESEKEVKEILDDELAFIAWQDYHTEDFFDVGEYSFFVNTNVEENYIYTYLPQSDNFDLSKPVSQNSIREYAEKMIGNNVFPTDDLVVHSNEVSITQLVETNNYVEYQIDYSDDGYENQQYRVFYKTIVKEEKTGKTFYLGNVEEKSIKEVFDLYLSGNNGNYTKVLYRDVKKNADCVYYTAFFVECKYEGEENRWTGNLFETIFVVDKDTREITQYIDLVKEAVIE